MSQDFIFDKIRLFTSITFSRLSLNNLKLFGVSLIFNDIKQDYL